MTMMMILNFCQGIRDGMMIYDNDDDDVGNVYDDDDDDDDDDKNCDYD